MILTVDIGNTEIYFGVYSHEDSLLASFRIKTSINNSSDNYAVDIINLLKLNNIDISIIKDCLIASVVPKTTDNLVNVIEKYFHITPIIVNNFKHDIININIINKNEVGIDRIVNSFAAFNQYSTYNLIVDFGTATTIDYVCDKGIYQGGIICPGISSFLDSLTNKTSLLPSIAIKKPSSVIGKSTVQAMESGIYYGYFGMIDHLLSLVIDDINKPDINIIITGGLGKTFYDETKYDKKICNPYLILEGLLLIYKNYPDLIKQTTE